MPRAARRFSRLQKRRLAWLIADARRPGGVSTRSHQELVVTLQGDKGTIRQRLRTLEARGRLVIGRSRGGKAASLSLTSAGQKWATPFTGRWEEERRPGTMLCWEATTSSQHGVRSPVFRNEAHTA